MASFAIGFLAGWIAYHILLYWKAMYRTCCIEHYLTHKTCKCKECALERS